MRVFRGRLSNLCVSFFPFGIEGKRWDVIVVIPDHAFLFYLGMDRYLEFILDKAKAFDRVNKDILFVTLANIGISSNMLDSINTGG